MRCRLPSIANLEASYLVANRNDFTRRITARDGIFAAPRDSGHLKIISPVKPHGMNLDSDLEAAVSAVLGDPVSAIKVIISLAKSPFFIREQLFWTKMEAFLNGVYLSEEDCAKLCAKLTEDGEKEENAFRLVENIA